MNLKNKLHEALLREFGEGDGLPFRRPSFNPKFMEYEFDIPNEDGEYTMITTSIQINNAILKNYLKQLRLPMVPNGGYIEIDFETETGGLSSTNKGDVIKIMTTVKAIINDLINYFQRNNQPIQMIMATPVYEKSRGETADTNSRKKLYTYLFQKYKPSGFTFFDLPSEGILGVYRIQNKSNEPEQ